MSRNRSARGALRSVDELLPPTGRVLFVTNDFPPQHGGIQTYVRQLCGDLPGHRVVVHAPHHPDAARYDAEQAFVVERDVRRLLLPTPALARRVCATIERHDIEHVVFGASVPLGLLARRLRSTGIRSLVALTHGHEVWWGALPGTRQALRRVAGGVDRLTYVSDYTGRRIATALDVGDRAKLTRLVPPVDASFNPRVDGRVVRERLGIPLEAPVAVCVARLVRRKGQDRLVRVWPAVLRQVPGAHLILVGDGPDRARLRRMVHRRHLEQVVHLVGQVESTPEYYAAGDVFAMPVRNRFFGLQVEGLGLSYLEAAACGLRVLPGKHGGAPEAATELLGDASLRA